MFKKIFEIDQSVAERITSKIKEENLPIKMEFGIVNKCTGMTKILFTYENFELLIRIISESTNEEYDLCAPYA